MTATDRELEALHAGYIAGELDRRPYFAAVAEIHAAMSARAELGACACLACRTTRELAELDTQEGHTQP